MAITTTIPESDPQRDGYRHVVTDSGAQPSEYGQRPSVDYDDDDFIVHQGSRSGEEEKFLPMEMASDSELAAPADNWKTPQNMFKIAAAYYGFLIFGMSDSSIGALLPTLENHYDLSYIVVSTAFLAPFCGYFVAALLSDYMHRRLGRWGVCVMGTSLQLVCYIIASTGPPFPVYVIGYAIAGLGNGMLEAGWNSWLGTLSNANEIMGLLHGFYGAGGVICPAVFTAMLENHIKWNYCYFVLIGMSFLSVSLCSIAYRKDTAKKYADSMDESNKEEDGAAQSSSITSVMKNSMVWLLAIALFMYVGGEVSFGGWISTFMIKIRNGDPDKMGYVTTGFWTGLTIGRVVLGFLMGYLQWSEQLFALFYMACALVCIVLLWVIPNLVVSAVFSGLFGLAIGPLFPIVMVVALQKLPRRLHVSGVGFAAAIGGAGAAVLPFVNGALATSYGPKVLCPLVLALFSAMMLIWLVIVKFY